MSAEASLSAAGARLKTVFPRYTSHLREAKRADGRNEFSNTLYCSL